MQMRFVGLSVSKSQRADPAARPEKRSRRDDAIVLTAGLLEFRRQPGAARPVVRPISQMRGYTRHDMCGPSSVATDRAGHERDPAQNSRAWCLSERSILSPPGRGATAPHRQNNGCPNAIWICGHSINITYLKPERRGMTNLRKSLAVC